MESNVALILRAALILSIALAEGKWHTLSGINGTLSDTTSNSSYNLNVTLENSSGSHPDNSSGPLTLISAIKNGYDTQAQNLMYLKNLTNIKDDQGCTALHWAARGGYMRIVDLLINMNGANVNAADHERKTPLHYLALWNFENGNYENISSVAKLLIQSGANTSAIDTDGRTALHLAIINGNEKVANILVADNKGYFDYTDNDSKTPLYYAAERGLKSVADFMLKRGASANHAKPALLAAIKNNHEEVAALLVKYGAFLTPANINELIVSLYLLVKGGHLC